MAKAELTEMERLHAQVARLFRKQLDMYEASGEPIPPSLLTSAAKFLKDNHIEAGIGNADMTDLEKAMRDMSNLPYDGEVPEEYKQ